MTDITNDTATTDEGKYEICDFSGFKAKPGTLVRTWNGHYVLPEYWEPRNMQDFARAKAESLGGSPRPEPTDEFIEDLYPSGVSAANL